MHRHQRPIPFPGPIPAGMMRISADIPIEKWKELLQASRRRGVHVDHLILAALDFAATR
jgi:hypothetical protein